MLSECECILLNAISSCFPVKQKLEAGSTTQVSTGGLAGYSGICAVGSLYYFIAGNGAFSIFQLFNGTSFNLLIHQTVPLPGKLQLSFAFFRIAC